MQVYLSTSHGRHAHTYRYHTVPYRTTCRTIHTASGALCTARIVTTHHGGKHSMNKCFEAPLQ